MSSQNSNTANGIHKDNSTQTSISDDIALLSAILSRSADPSDETDIAELLRQIETAQGVADGVESRLDGVIDHLDGLLDSLEARDTRTSQGDTATHVAPKPQENNSDRSQQG